MQILPFPRTKLVTRYSTKTFALRNAQIKTVVTSGRTLTLTPEHHLPVGAQCCSHLKKAKDVAVGETVWAASHVTAGAASLVTAQAGAVSLSALSVLDKVCTFYQPPQPPNYY